MKSISKFKLSHTLPFGKKITIKYSLLWKRDEIPTSRLRIIIGRLLDGTGCIYVPNHINFIKRISKIKVNHALSFGKKLA